jgi:hypothetical protein
MDECLKGAPYANSHHSKKHQAKKKDDYIVFVINEI